MSFTEILKIIIELIVVIIGILIISLYPKLNHFISEKISEKQLEQIRQYIYTFVISAEQLFKQENNSRWQKKEYVTKMLNKMGIEVTEQIDALIEAEVYHINKQS